VALTLRTEIDAEPRHCADLCVPAPAVGARVEPAGAEFVGSTKLNSPKPKKARRWLWWILALLLAFVVGVLLGRMMARKCPHCPAAAVLGNGGGGGARER
jgi:hypothetical protein